MSSAVPQGTVPQKAAPQKDGEFDLLCALASADLTPERIRRIAAWNPSSVDWSVFLRLAEHHGVLPLAARHLIDHARGLPTEIERVVLLRRGRVLADGSKEKTLTGERLSELFGVPVKLFQEDGYFHLHV